MHSSEMSKYTSSERTVVSGRRRFASAESALNALVRLARYAPSQLRRGLWHVFAAELGLVGGGLRYVIGKSLAAACLENVYFGPRVTIVGWENLEIGRNVSIHRNAYIDASGGVFIGNDVSIAHDVSILSFEHGHADPSRPIKYNPLRLAEVRIHDDVWIGCGARILAGVGIGHRAIVAAGAVVVEDVPSGTIVGGVPARVVKKIA
jgi:acetyltransferase-like isoleucine patch superfamily enzyme